LFWKKSNKKEEVSKKEFSIPSEVRSAFRVVPQLDSPLKATLNGKPILILDISSGGFSFKKINLEMEKFYLAEIVLPLEGAKFSTLVKLLNNNNENYYRCQFVDLPQETEDLIHRYVLHRQKEEQEINNELHS
jgi:hypothetical protein